MSSQCRHPPTEPPFAVPDQLVGSGRTFTSNPANWTDLVWDKTVVQEDDSEWPVSDEAAVRGAELYPGEEQAWAGNSRTGLIERAKKAAVEFRTYKDRCVAMLLRHIRNRA